MSVMKEQCGICAQTFILGVISFIYLFFKCLYFLYSGFSSDRINLSPFNIFILF